MSDDDKEADPDYEPVFSTIDIRDLRADGSASTSVGEVYVEEGTTQVTKATDTDVENDGKSIRKYSPYYRPRPKKNRRTSLIWTKFTIVDEKRQIASCNICNQRMSIKSTSGNLKKHLERKHGYSIKLGVLPYKRSAEKVITPTPRPKVSELAGISEEGITVKVVGENGEEEHFQVLGEQYMSEEVVQEEIHEHDYSTVEQQENERERESEQIRIGKVRSLNESQPSHSRRGQYSVSSYSHLDEKTKRNKIMELQVECLENKKYMMQLEALLLEQQLNMPRSIFTQPLKYVDVQTRGTQTEVGGSDTRVFYITDKRGGRPSQQLFTLQEVDDF